ncbi:MAG TPA: hypothetical protein VM925_14185 [Labilithrix sp.]|jgi:hypothetical protein|nr:hypothetical protein [Labilithrix sp.]
MILGITLGIHPWAFVVFVVALPSSSLLSARNVRALSLLLGERTARQ